MNTNIGSVSATKTLLDRLPISDCLDAASPFAKSKVSDRVCAPVQHPWRNDPMNRRALIVAGLGLLCASALGAPASAAFYWEGLGGGCNCGTPNRAENRKTVKRRSKVPRVWNKATAPRDYKGSRRVTSRKVIK